MFFFVCEFFANASAPFSIKKQFLRPRPDRSSDFSVTGEVHSIGGPTALRPSAGMPTHDLALASRTRLVSCQMQELLFYRRASGRCTARRAKIAECAKIAI